MRNIPHNLRVLWSQLSRGMRVFVAVSFGATYIFLSCFIGVLPALAAVVGVSLIMIGFLATVYADLLVFPGVFTIAIPGAFALLLRACGVVSPWAAIIAFSLTGWCVLLCILTFRRFENPDDPRQQPQEPRP